MKYFILCCYILFNSLSSIAQELYPEIMENRPSFFTTSIKNKHRISFPQKLVLKQYPYSSISNTGLRFVIQQVENHPTNINNDINMNQSIMTLLGYAKNEQMRQLLYVLKKYTRLTAEKERALGIVSTYIREDSMRFKNEQDFLSDEPYISDLKLLLDYVRNDTLYNWLRKISRDSVPIQLFSSRNDSLRLWLSTGKDHFHRFWGSTRTGDTIGTWIQVMPNNNGIRIYMDEGVYQTNEIKLRPKKRPIVLNNPIDNWYFNLNRMTKGVLHRRYWTYYSEVDMALSQGKLINWASGGENSFSLLSNVRYFWNYNKNNLSWENWIHYRFGFLKSGEEDLRKNEDRFELNSKLGQKAFKHWYYTLQFNTRTQLFNSYDYPKDKDRVLVANFMSPGYFTLSLGLDFKPNDNLSVFISPISGQWNFVRDTAKIDASRYGIEPGERSKRKAGARIDIRNKFNNIFDVINIRNEMSFFLSYENEDKLKDKEPKKPYTASWKLNIDFKINYFMQASIYTETIFDENYSKKLQFRENLGLGVKFRF